VAGIFPGRFPRNPQNSDFFSRFAVENREFFSLGDLCCRSYSFPAKPHVVREILLLEAHKMNNSKISLGMLVMVLAFGLILGGCPTEDNGDGGGTGWYGTYKGGPSTFSLHENGNASWTGFTNNIPNGSWKNVTIENGGDITLGGETVGQWVYVKTTSANTWVDGSGNTRTVPQGRIGIILKHPDGFAIGIGTSEANYILSVTAGNGGTLLPAPATASFTAPTNWFAGEK
jgi:hypothetical protein